jgi:hypothetical protein
MLNFRRSNCVYSASGTVTLYVRVPHIESDGARCCIYTVRSKSSRTKAIKTEKRRRVFFSVYLFKIGSIRC